MTPFDYQRATSVADAVNQLGAHGVFLAGGTNLVDHLRLGISTPQQLMDISRLPLTDITRSDDGVLHVGALVRNSDMAAHPLIRQHLALVSQALLAGASGQLRNMATTGGNLLQRTRCVYFQDLTTPCNKRRPGSGCSAQAGFGRYNALFGTSSSCVAVHPSDLCVALAALEVTVVIHSRQGERRLPYADLHRLPGDTPEHDTHLQHGEMITALEISPLPPTWQSRYRKVRDRASYAFALVSVAAALDVRGGVVHGVRLALGGASHKPHRASIAEAQLLGGPATHAAFVAAAHAELAHAQPGADNAFKVPMLRNTMAAVLGELAQAPEGAFA